jgi:DNA polymerase III subunit epsilon
MSALELKESDVDQPLEAIAQVLEASGDFRVLRRLVPRPVAARPVAENERVGIVIDTETTGLDATKDEVVELALLKFHYTLDGAVVGVTGAFDGFIQPSAPLPEKIVQLTSLTDSILAGASINPTAVQAFLEGAHFVVAHNAGFDRRFAERYWPTLSLIPWGCSATQIQWRDEGFAGANPGLPAGRRRILL